MATPLRLVGFTATLVVLLGAGFGLGRAVEPIDTTTAAHHDDHVPVVPSAAPGPMPGGLAVSAHGLTLALDRPQLPRGRQRLDFRILDDDGEPVVDYDPVHERALHLVVVRRDLSAFHHLHPRLAGDGTWTASLDLTPGAWRVFADFTATGHPAAVLGADLQVPGRVGPVTPPTPTRRAVVDGYEVRLTGDLVAGGHGTLRFDVSRDGAPVTDLQPYLGSFGHLVALRDGDLGYLHVHPEDGPPGPAVAFGVEPPTAGRYHLFLGFAHRGAVHTAAFVLETDSEVGEGVHDDHDG